MRICLFEDRRAADLYPLTFTRPASHLLCGLTTLGAKQARYFGANVVGHLCRPVLAEWLRERENAPVNDPTWLRAGPTVLVNGRWLAPPTAPIVLQDWLADGPFIGIANGEIVFAALDQRRLQAVSPATVEDCLRDWAQSLPCHEVGGTLIRYSWELIEHNGAEITRDFEVTCDPTEIGDHLTDITLVGSGDRLFIHPTARVEPHVVADTTNGPVVIGEGAVVTAFTRLEGPCGIGPHAHARNAQIRGGTSIGPHCRVGGEVEASIVLGYTNKSHDGYLGYSFVGEWVDIAAGVVAADQRCDFGPISAPVNGAKVLTNRTKMGSVIGDHAKICAGALLNCGSSIGAFTQVLPTGVPAPREVPAFHEVGPDGLKPLDATQLLAVAETVVRERGDEPVPQLSALYRTLAGAPEPAPEVAPPTLPAVPLRKSA
ncbi:UDP-N-acetylglucosamine diphosphorylase/glucosamine-1-phosphate N-acetyltransferase OS=Singulisphaera acidiphila (strain ATCC BAA-1392 / DSM 18658 / VKM B-2454 / MOB10) GN=Sinac_3268 PE=4 SV=1: NTP_transf_4 [Gemmata massiliana]|uniref:Glucose-1-phosphate thymidylyltransferase n=1 Tax=Gemmata massiliana TaxID=1210884 RepID=A0A6P2CPW7_9BACT|nr:putative sugar nucleotidyl transferase [Gemmata massiliana]VTR90991.1 UDP-N-acetylglucosamine diphosphorylase/glucosamine-1-phosphate N-acetyltransferase OS=Singulisphaera acidiphila (strain ATCC BAA-1392 / DSM 18658 / VKM B-2454 / MOB10) GN=Sinac_3268 PE=4 SV=1: NTP_transf_4 [Gemmata massiliana]